MDTKLGKSRECLTVLRNAEASPHILFANELENSGVALMAATVYHAWMMKGNKQHTVKVAKETACNLKIPFNLERRSRG